MGKYILKVIHEEPISVMTLEQLRGGATCTCNAGSSFNCKCVGASNYCACNATSSFTM